MTWLIHHEVLVLFVARLEVVSEIPLLVLLPDQELGVVVIALLLDQVRVQKVSFVLLVLLHFDFGVIVLF